MCFDWWSYLWGIFPWPWTHIIFVGSVELFKYIPLDLDTICILVRFIVELCSELPLQFWTNQNEIMHAIIITWRCVSHDLCLIGWGLHTLGSYGFRGNFILILVCRTCVVIFSFNLQQIKNHTSSSVMHMAKCFVGLFRFLARVNHIIWPNTLDVGNYHKCE